MNVLIITAAMPFPPMSGGQLRTFHIAKAIARQHAVKVVGFTYGERHEAPPYAAEVVAVPWAAPRLYNEMKSENPEQAKRASRLLDADLAEPWLASCYDVPAMEDAIGQHISQGVDLVLFEGTPLARFLPLVPAGIPRILDLMDLCSLMAQRAADCAQGEAQERAGREATRVRTFESWAAGECDALLVCSERELEHAQRLIGIRLAHVIANGVDTKHFMPKRGKPESGNVLFTSNFGYAPNAEGARYFVREIWPLITEHVPEATLHLVGAHAGPAVCALAGAQVRVHGQVADMAPYQERASVVVVPLLRGGGTRLKILEAAASGNAIVSTQIGADGLDFTDGENLLIRDGPEDFARAVLKVLEEPTLRASLGSKARERSGKYDWAGIERHVLEVVNTMQPAFAEVNSMLDNSARSISRDGLHERYCQLPCGLRLEIDNPDEFIQRSIIQNGVFEPGVTNLVGKLLSCGDHFFDVGANIGYFSLLGAAQGAVVHAFEPVPRLAASLSRNVALNKLERQVHIVQSALSNRCGSATLYVAERADDGSHSLLAGVEATAIQAITVGTTTLDTYLGQKNYPIPTLIKLDVEGAEALVLDGARRTLEAATAPVWVFETGDRLANQLGESASSVVTRFWDRGYRVFHVHSKPPFLVEVAKGALSRELSEYVAIRPESPKVEIICSLINEALKARLQWLEQTKEAAEELSKTIGREATFILIDNNDLAADLGFGSRAMPFLERDGQYWGPPPDDATAILECQRLQRAGASFIAFAHVCFWWLEHYAGFLQHLRHRFPCVLKTDKWLVFSFAAVRSPVREGCA